VGAANPKADRPIRAARSGIGGFVALMLLLVAPAAVQAQEITFPTHLIDIAQGSALSDTAKSLGTGGYELSDGTWVSLAKWYHTDWPDTYVEMLTQLGDDFGILWGFSTGEAGEKYTIDPSLRLGFIAQAHPSSNAVLSLSVRSILWGDLTEQTCEGDYGEIGGVQTVNCRLAASLLPPEETLQYLADAEPSRLHISLSYSASF
jgi:hypothetical protein